MLVDLLSARDKHRPETLKSRSLASDEVPKTTLTTPLQSGADTRGSGPERGQECIQDKRGGRDVVQALQRDSTISLSPNSHDPTKVNGVQIAQPFWRKAGVMRRSLKTLMNLMPERLGTSLGHRPRTQPLTRHTTCCIIHAISILSAPSVRTFRSRWTAQHVFACHLVCTSRSSCHLHCDFLIFRSSIHTQRIACDFYACLGE